MLDVQRERILRKLAGLPDEKIYQVLDYIEFLESKYSAGAGDASAFQKIAETVEDTLRAGRLPAAAIKGTMGAVDAAGRVMRGLNAAGQAARKELGDASPEDAEQGKGQGSADDSTGGDPPG